MHLYGAQGKKIVREHVNTDCPFICSKWMSVLLSPCQFIQETKRIVFSHLRSLFDLFGNLLFM